MANAVSSLCVIAATNRKKSAKRKIFDKISHENSRLNALWQKYQKSAENLSDNVKNNQPLKNTETSVFDNKISVFGIGFGIEKLSVFSVFGIGIRYTVTSLRTINTKARKKCNVLGANTIFPLAF